MPLYNGGMGIILLVFFSTPFLGMMYYFVPKAEQTCITLTAYRFYILVFDFRIYWSGPHHLLYTALPEWAQSLGVVFSIILIAPSWGGMINGMLTMRSSWDRVRVDPVLKFFVLALTFCGWLL